MPYKTIKELSVVTGKYTDRNGNEKAQWKSIGRMLKSENGKYVIVIDRTFNPAGVPIEDGRCDSVMVQLFDPKERHSQSTGQKTEVPPPAKPQVSDDEIPF